MALTPLVLHLEQKLLEPPPCRAAHTHSPGPGRPRSWACPQIRACVGLESQLFSEQGTHTMKPGPNRRDPWRRRRGREHWEDLGKGRASWAPGAAGRPASQWMHVLAKLSMLCSVFHPLPAQGLAPFCGSVCVTRHSFGAPAPGGSSSRVLVLPSAWPCRAGSEPGWIRNQALQGGRPVQVVTNCTLRRSLAPAAGRGLPVRLGCGPAV